MRRPQRRRIALALTSAFVSNSPSFARGGEIGAVSPGAESDAAPMSFEDAIGSLGRGRPIAVVAAGEHRLHNPAVFRGLGGVLRFAPGARVVVSDPDSGGLRFIQSKGLTIEGLRLAWPVRASVRTHFGAALMFVLCESVTVRRLEIDGAAGAGLHFDTCEDVQVEDASVTGSRADGIHFANCRDVRASGLRTRDTGDDGVACVDYERAPRGGRHVLRGVRVEGSAARGIAIVGARQVELTDFLVRRTASSGLLIATDNHYRTRRPASVRVSAGAVTEGGRGVPPAGNRFGIEVIEADDVAISDVRIVNSRTRSVSAVRIGRTLSFKDLHIEPAPDAGGPALEVRDADQVSVLRLEVERTAALALLVERCTQFNATDVRLRGVASGGPGVAARFGGPGRIEVDHLTVVGNAEASVALGAGLDGWIAVDAPRIADATGGTVRLMVSKRGRADAQAPDDQTAANR